MDEIYAVLEKLKESKPLIHHITNWVTIYDCANVTRVLGALPVMAHAAEEVEEMASGSQALVLNIGTLTEEWVESMIKAGRKAAACNIPVILDPVGSGATALRTRSACRIIAETRPAVVRGNASEVLSLVDASSKTRGVDSAHAVGEATAAARSLALELGATLAITGPEDLVTDGARVVRVANGHPLMGRVTGTGCAATVTIGAFLAVDPDPVSATATALAYFGLAGEVAARHAAAPGSFMIRMLDALYTITPEQLEKECRIEASDE
jgi:hydroxyethylthiazole kinase